MRSAGADLSLHFKGSNNLTAFVLGSNTADGEDEGQGIGLQANYDTARDASAC